MVPAADLQAPLHTEPGRYRIAMLAPPWIPVPPSGYGGIESVIALLCRALVTRGHRVTLYAAPGSRSCAEVVEPSGRRVGTRSRSSGRLRPGRRRGR